MYKCGGETIKGQLLDLFNFFRSTEMSPRDSHRQLVQGRGSHGPWELQGDFSDQLPWETLLLPVGEKANPILRGQTF